MTVPIIFPVFINESLMKVPGLTELLNPVMVPDVLVAVQVNKDAATFEVNVILVLVFEQIGGLGEVVNKGTGFTVTT